VPSETNQLAVFYCCRVYSLAQAYELISMPTAISTTFGRVHVRMCFPPKVTVAGLFRPLASARHHGGPATHPSYASAPAWQAAKKSNADCDRAVATEVSGTSHVSTSRLSKPPRCGSIPPSA
jgi:hypothetical protein